ncbi:serine/threonine-protein phosphatase 4 regulatory subunit 4-like [Dermacentor silvarum]|uniref:serine/threonine-protein phosphatase 4 regulatory subunit 4-like n=1 Tax=Dermacentor silvarum TaxID=543639 RepID=UPI00189B454F|nr:serine/threonine-protein phosphatase 4 regulatory subunit 4-like [Dermacentor silvarum]
MLGLLDNEIMEKDGLLVELYRELSTAGLYVSKSSPDRRPTSQARGTRGRRTCAHFFPDLVQFVTAESFEVVLLPMWQRLCADPDSSVHSVIASALIQARSVNDSHLCHFGLLVPTMVTAVR